MGFCGVASEISTLVTENVFDYLDHEPIRVTTKPAPLPYAKNLEQLALPSIDDIVYSAKKLLKNNYLDILMPIEILMPALSPTMKEGNLAKWVKRRR